MLETFLHQGASLTSFTPESALRLLPIISQPDAPHDLETLWQVCFSLQRLGYPVVVLDGTALETEDAPGLADLLAQSPWHESALLDSGGNASSLAVVPAAMGLAQMAREASRAPHLPAIAQLHPYFRAYGLVVLYAPVHLMAPLLRDQRAMPLVIAKSGPEGVVQSYTQLKHMALHAGVRCFVASIVAQNDSLRAQRAAASLQSLQRCADSHLGSPFATVTIRAGHLQDIQRLALQLLENAGTIADAVPPAPSIAAVRTPAHFVRSH